jgi:hypothetical protein
MGNPVEKIYTRGGYRDGVNIWGHLYLDKTGQSVGGWLINTWNELRDPKYPSQFNWFDPVTKKIHKANVGFTIEVLQEDTDIDPFRKQFIRDSIAEWESDWLKEKPY